MTRNRRDLLLQCLRALASQSVPPTHVVVVVNAGTDDTVAQLAQLFPQHTVLELATNTGSAGGFYQGLAWARERHFERFWLMDDDGVPAGDCLAHLHRVLTQAGGGACGPLVIATEDAGQLAFALWDGRGPASALLTRVSDVRARAAGAGSLPLAPAFFNGVLLDHKVLAGVGLPDPGLFLWGDEVEYCHRIVTAGFPLHVACDAEFFHPRNRQVWTRTKPGWSVLTSPTDARLRYYFRNLGFIHRRYKPNEIPRHLAKYTYYYMWERGGDLATLGRMLWWYVRGLCWLRPRHPGARTN